MSNAWAVRQSGAINIKTVHDTPRGAMANGLLMLFGIMPMSTWTDAEIEGRWNVRAPRADAAIVEVDVTLAHPKQGQNHE